MNVLLDHSVPAPLRNFLLKHTFRTAAQEGWDALTNGELLVAADARFDVFVTCDQNMSHQQNPTGRGLSKTGPSSPSL